jgi:hypothetical protein
MHMMQKHYRRAAAAASSLTALTAGAYARAQGLGTQTGLDETASAGGIKTTADLSVLVGRFINAALGILGTVFVVLVIYAGFLWMTAAGNDEKVKQAKKIITGAVAGLVLIFTSYAIVTFVVSAIDRATTSAV